MSASHTRLDRVLSVREREKLRNEIREKERMLQGHFVVPGIRGAGPEGMSARRMGRWEGFIDRDIREDAGLLNSQVRHLRNILDKGSPRSLNKRERAVLEKQVIEDSEYFKKHMVGKRLYNEPSVLYSGENRRPNPKFEKSQKAVYEKEVVNVEFQKRADRFKNNMREIDPDNPDSSNIEKFRPK